MNTCNEKCLLEATAATGESRKLIEQVLDHQSRLVASKIKEGGFESVRIPYFGIFQAKLRSIQIKNYMKMLPKSTSNKS